MHAEIEAMKKAKDKGLRGGKAVLMVMVKTCVLVVDQLLWISQDQWE